MKTGGPQPPRKRPQGGSETGPWSAGERWDLQAASLEAKHLGGANGCARGLKGVMALSLLRGYGKNISSSLKMSKSKIF